MSFKKASELDQRRPLVIVCYGGAGVGKSTFSQSFKSPIAVIDLEDKRAKNTANDFFEGKDIRISECLEWMIDDKGKRVHDGIKTLKNIDNALISLHKDYDTYNTIVMDGATYIRNYCADEYCARTGAKAVFGVKGNTTVNKRMKKIFQTVIGYKNYGKNIIITTQRKADYQPTGRLDKQGNMIREKAGWIANIKEFVEHDVDITIFMRLISTPWGMKRVSSFTKHAIVGNIPLNLGFVDLTYAMLKKIHYGLKFNKKKAERLQRPIESWFDKNSVFNIEQMPSMKRVCIFCGASVTKDAKFCLQCGKEIRDVQEFEEWNR